MDEGARAATTADVARIVELARLMHQELTGVRGGEVWAVNEARVPEPETYESLIDDGIVLVGTIDDFVVGFASAHIVTLRDGTRLGSIRELFVEPDARMVGIGEALIELLLEQMRAAGAHRVDAFALPGHRAAKNFFEEQGMTARLIVMHREL